MPETVEGTKNTAMAGKPVNLKELEINIFY